MEIYLIRHTTPDIAKGICYGQADLDVTSNFAKEVKNIHSQVSITNQTKVYSSPLQRCTKLAETFELPIHKDHRLMEVNFGQWELKSWKDIPKDELDPWMKDFINIAPPNGESYKQVQQRVSICFQEIIHSNAHQIVVCTHATPIRILVAQVQQIALENSFEIKVDYGQIFKFIYADNKLVLVS